MDLAAQLWQQMLMVDATSPEALRSLAEAAVRAGDLPMARSYFERLRAVDPLGAEPSASWMLQPRRWADLREADELRRQSKFEQATRRFRQVFGAEPPQGSWTLPFYEAEAATPEGHQQAIAQLRRLRAQEPELSAYAMSLGRLLTYDSESRSEGMRLLERYPEDPAATQALQQARVWEERDAKDPARMAERERQSGYRALQAENVEVAELHFRKSEKLVPRDGRTTAGLAYVAMRRQDFAEAIRLFETAETEQHRGIAGRAALREAHFYLAMSQAGHASERSELAVAAQQYSVALAMKPTSLEAMRGLAGVYLASHQSAKAEAVFERMTLQSAGEMSGWRGLVEASLAFRGSRSAAEVEARAPEEVRIELARDPALAEEFASALTAEGRDGEACEHLRMALLLPIPPAQTVLRTRLEARYAEALTRTARFSEAEALLRAMLDADPRNPDAWRDLLDVEHHGGHDDAALHTLSTMPEAVRAQALAQHGVAQEVAAVYQAGGQLDEAQRILEELLSGSEGFSAQETRSAELQLAGVYQRAGKSALAAAAYRDLLRSKKVSVAAWTGLLTVLHSTREDITAAAEMDALPPQTKAELEQSAGFLGTEASVLEGVGRKADAYAAIERLEAVLARLQSIMPSELLLQQAWLQYALGKDEAIQARLEHLHQRKDLQPQQQRSSELLVALVAMRTAGQHSDEHNFAAARAVLDAAAKALPARGEATRLLAGGYLRTGAPAEALRIFLGDAPASPSEYRAAIAAALASGRIDLAKVWLAAAMARYPQEGALLTLAADMNETEGRDALAMRQLRSALRAQQEGSAADRSKALLELAGLEARYSGWSESEAYVRRRTGKPGLDQMIEIGVPVSSSVTRANAVRLGVTSTEVLLSSGSASRNSGGSDTSAAAADATFGSQMLTGASAPASSWLTGQAGSVAVATQRASFSVGYTPYGFPVSHVVGRAEYTGNHGRLGIFTYRDPVRDTVLSYAGAYNPGSYDPKLQTSWSAGRVWGGVIAAGAGARVHGEIGRGGWYGEAAVSRLTGQHVERNTKIEGTSGVYWSVPRAHVPGSLNVGVNLFLMHYSHNGRALTYGSGGYFSPQSYVLTSLPLRWELGRERRWSHALTGVAGVQRIRESSAPLFPLDPALQSMAASLCAPSPASIVAGGRSCTSAKIAASRSTGANFEVASHLTYRPTPLWVLSGAFSASNSKGYTQVESGVSVRYFFRRQIAAGVETGNPLQRDAIPPLRLP